MISPAIVTVQKLTQAIQTQDIPAVKKSQDRMQVVNKLLFISKDIRRLSLGQKQMKSKLVSSIMKIIEK